MKKGKKMSEEREIMDVYTGSNESEQIDMWLFIPGLRPQFDEIDNLAMKKKKPADCVRGTRSSGVPGFWQRNFRSAGAGS